jgi:lactate dehydrogenase-like 2-hydroxyacid dehydrogenase
MEEGNPLLHVKHMERLAMSPHVAWASVEARAELIRLVGENIKDYIGE